MGDIGTIIMVTAGLIGLFLVLKYSSGFKTAFGEIGLVFDQAVTALMGPGGTTKGG